MRNVILVTGFTCVVAIMRTDSAPAACTGKAITCGSTVTDSISSSGSCVINTFPTAVYSFNGIAGQSLTLTASTSTGFTIGLELSNSAGQLIASDFDEPASVHATLPSTGQYTISVNFGNPHQSGSFSLTASCVSSTPAPTTCAYTSVVSIGGSVSGQLTAADAACGDGTSYAKAYRVPVIAGDTFDITYSANYQPFLEIKGPDSSAVLKWSTGTSVTTTYIAPVTGNITIYAGTNTVATIGSFSIVIVPAVAPPCGKVRAVRH